MPRRAKPKQPRLLPKLAPIRPDDDIPFSDLTTHHYACRCGNRATTGIRLEAIVCTRCGSAMTPITTHERKPS